MAKLNWQPMLQKCPKKEDKAKNHSLSFFLLSLRAVYRTFSASYDNWSTHSGEPGKNYQFYFRKKS